MWRGLFLAIGAYAVVAGLQCMVCDKALLTTRDEAPALGMIANGSASGDAVKRRELVPPEWAPWSLLSGGAVTMLYSFTIPKRVKE